MGRRRGPRALIVAVALALSLPSAGSASAQVAGESTWIPTYPVEAQTTQYLDLMPDGTGYAATLYTFDWKLARTDDYGMTWADASMPVRGPISFGTPALGYLTEDFGNRLFVTQDGTETWEVVRTLKDRRILMVDAWGRRTVVTGSRTLTQHAAECDVPAEKTIFSWSNDGGRKWRESSLPFYGSVLSIDVLDRRNATAIVYDSWVAEETDECRLLSRTNAVYVTNDGGRSWRRVMHCVDGLYCTAATMADRRTILVGTNEATLLRSVDGGKTFDEVGRFFNPAYSPAESLQAFWIAGLDFATREIGYASTKGGGTYRTLDGGKTWTMERSTELVWGVGVGDLAVADADHAIAGGPNFLITRLPGDG